MFHDKLFLERCFRSFVLQFLEYCSAVFCSAADTHLKLLDCAVSGARFLAGGVFECDIAHRRSVAVLCLLYKIRCNPMHPLSDALPGPYLPVRVTRRALVAHRFTYAPPRCRTSQYHSTFVFSQRPSGTILLTPYSMVWDWRVSRPGQCFFIGLSCSIPTIVFYYFSISLLPVYRLVLWGWGFGLIGCISLSLSLALPKSFNNNNNNIVLDIFFHLET